MDIGEKKVSYKNDTYSLVNNDEIKNSKRKIGHESAFRDYF